MLFLLTTAGLLASAAPNRVALARAVDAYHQQSRDVRPELAALLEQRPWDDDVAFWLARAELDNGQCERAAELLWARDGVGIDSAEFRAWQAQALVCTGDLEQGWEQGLQAQDLDPRSVAYRPHQALMGLLSHQRGQATQAAAYLHRAGGSPDLSLSPAVRRQVPERVLGVHVLQATPGELTVQVLSGVWVLDLSTGLMVPGAPRPAPRLPPRLAQEPAPRSMGRGCENPTWASPAEPLASGAGGIFELRGDRVAQRVSSRPGQQLESPLCHQGSLSYLSRSPGREGPVTHLVQDAQVLALDGVPVSFDVGEGGVVLHLLDGRVLVDGVQRFESELALSSPRWSSP